MSSSGRSGIFNFARLNQNETETDTISVIKSERAFYFVVLSFHINKRFQKSFFKMPGFEVMSKLLNLCSVDELKTLKKIVCEKLKKKDMESGTILSKSKAKPSILSNSSETPIVITKKLGRPRKNKASNTVRHVCNFCKKSFATVYTKNRHEFIHTKERPFKCDFCPKQFLQEGAKIIHERIHTGEKPFECKFCKRAFISKANKNYHEKSWHRQLIE